MQTGGNQEVLVVRKNIGTLSTTPPLGNAYKIRQAISPRVFTVESTGSELDTLQKMPDLTVISGDQPLPESIDDLTESEKLFVAAWISRQRKPEAKQRFGDGLSWDAPGFTPPDPPAK